MSASELVKPKAILFDWDNTLVDSWAVIFDALNYTLEAFGKPSWTMSQTQNRVRKSLRDSFPKLFGDDWEKAADVFYGRFDAIHLKQLSPLEGAAEMLAELARAGLYLGVVSNKRGEYLRKEAAHLGWDRHFSQLIGATDATADKPSTEPVDMALAGFDRSRGADIWFVGDADIDMECAFNANLTPILLRAKAPKPYEFDKHPPVYHASDCLTLCKTVLRM